MTSLNPYGSGAWSHSPQERKALRILTSRTLLIPYWKSNENCTSSAIPVKKHKNTQGYTLLLSCSYKFPVIFLRNFLVLASKALYASGPGKSLFHFPSAFLTLLFHIFPAPSLSSAAFLSGIFHTLVLWNPCCLHIVFFKPLETLFNCMLTKIVSYNLCRFKKKKPLFSFLKYINLVWDLLYLC